MKNLIRVTIVILMSLTHTACRSTRTSQRLQTRFAVQEKIDIKSEVQQMKDYSRSESVTDSSSENYYLTIFPADTFHFSLQNGFIGKASKLVLRGSSNQITRVFDTSRYTGSINSEQTGNLRRDSVFNMTNRSVSAKGRGTIWIGLIAGLMVGLLLVKLKTYIQAHIVEKG